MQSAKLRVRADQEKTFFEGKLTGHLFVFHNYVVKLVLVLLGCRSLKGNHPVSVVRVDSFSRWLYHSVQFQFT